MRQLSPKVVEERKKRLLQWVIHRYIKSSAPIASQEIAKEAGLGLSSASIRNVLQELEEEGYLHQPHTSSGRVPTDKGYRFYVDYLIGVQRLASQEKEKIEQQYHQRSEEMDRLLLETSKLLSHVSRSAGLVLSPKLEKHSLKRLEILPIGGKQALAVLVTESGLIRHWPIKLGFVPTARQLERLNRFLNENIQSKSIRDVRSAIQSKLHEAQREIEELDAFASVLLDGMSLTDDPGELYLEGTTKILAHPEELGDLREIQSLMQVIDGKRALAELLQREMEGAGSESSKVQVRIGRENDLPALRNMSLVTTTYRFKNQVVGVLGVLGTKRMEYSKMMGLVNEVSAVVSRALESFVSDFEEPEDGSQGYGKKR